MDCRFSGEPSRVLTASARSRENRSGSLGSKSSAPRGLEGDQDAGLPVHHHLRDAAHLGGHHGGPAGHGFQVDDAEGLVYRGADEDGGMAVQGDDLLLGSICSIQMMGWEESRRASSTCRVISSPISVVSGAPAQRTTWVPSREVADGVDEVQDALLAGDAAHEEDEWACPDRCRRSPAGPGSGAGRYSSRSMPLGMTRMRSWATP